MLFALLANISAVFSLQRFAFISWVCESIWRDVFWRYYCANFWPFTVKGHRFDIFSPAAVLKNGTQNRPLKLGDKISDPLYHFVLSLCGDVFVFLSCFFRSLRVSNRWTLPLGGPIFRTKWPAKLKSSVGDPFNLNHFLVIIRLNCIFLDALCAVFSAIFSTAFERWFSSYMKGLF